MGRGQNINITKSLEEVDFTPHDDLEGFNTSVEKITADVVKIARELEIKVEPEDVTALLQSHDKTLVDEELLLLDEQRKWLLEMEFTPGKDVMKTVAMTTKDLENHINLIDKAATRFERTHSHFERSSTVSKKLSHSIAYYREVSCERKSQSMWQTCLYF